LYRELYVGMRLPYNRRKCLGARAGRKSFRL